MFLKRLFRRVFLVLTESGHNDTTVFEFLDPFLKPIKSMSHPNFADLNVLHAVIADHAAPNRVVQIKDQAQIKPIIWRPWIIPARLSNAKKCAKQI